MRDPYAVLGVQRTASDTEIKNAYRRQAKRLHPDMHDGDAALEARFQEIQDAYALLKDRARRRLYDTGQPDDPRPAQRSSFEEELHAARAREETNAHTGTTRPDRESVFSDFLSTFRKARRNLESDTPPPPPKPVKTGPVILQLTFGEAMMGARKTVLLPNGKRVAITVPPGAEDGQTIQMRNATSGKSQNMVPTELSVILAVTPDPRFVREGYDLLTTLPISLDEALLGAKVRLDAPGGELLVTVPRGGNTGQVLKLRGRGVPRGEGDAGDLLITLNLKLPPVIDSELEAVIKSWAARHPYNARGEKPAR